jgi:hypothetical protein
LKEEYYGNENNNDSILPTPGLDNFHLLHRQNFDPAFNPGKTSQHRISIRTSYQWQGKAEKRLLQLTDRSKFRHTIAGLAG